MKIAYGDWKTKRITDKLLLWLVAAGIICIWVFPEISILQRLGGLFVVSVPLLILACVVPGSIGGGDIKLIAAGGFLLGIENVFRAFAIGVFLSAIYVWFLLLTKKADRKSEIALGPFLCLGLVYSLLLI